MFRNDEATHNLQLRAHELLTLATGAAGLETTEQRVDTAMEGIFGAVALFSHLVECERQEREKLKLTGHPPSKPPKLQLRFMRRELQVAWDLLNPSSFHEVNPESVAEAMKTLEDGRLFEAIAAARRTETA